MTEADIIRMAREIGMPVSETFGPMVGACPVGDLLQRFAALVAAHEREECAKVCEQHELESHNTIFLGASAEYLDGRAMGAQVCASYIRQRGTP